VKQQLSSCVINARIQDNLKTTSNTAKTAVSLFQNSVLDSKLQKINQK
jgi:hypothetical protein